MSITLFNPSKDPVPNRRFGDKPVSGVSKIAHLGNDYGWGDGDGVYAAADGVVMAVNWVNNRLTDNRSGGYGNNIQIDHGNGYSTLYGHMPNSAPWVKVGQHVNRGDQIGVMGNTGNAAGRHLHFELRFNGNIIDPNPYIVAGSIAGKGSILSPADSSSKTPVTPPKPAPLPLPKDDIMAQIVRNSKTGWIGVLGLDLIIHISGKEDDLKTALKVYHQTAALELSDAEFVTALYLNLIPTDLHANLKGIRYYNGNRNR